MVNSLLGAFARQRRADDALALYRSVLGRQGGAPPPDAYTFAAVLNALSKVRGGGRGAAAAGELVAVIGSRAQPPWGQAAVGYDHRRSLAVPKRQVSSAFQGAVGLLARGVAGSREVDRLPPATCRPAARRPPPAGGAPALRPAPGARAAGGGGVPRDARRRRPAQPGGDAHPHGLPGGRLYRYKWGLPRRSRRSRRSAGAQRPHPRTAQLGFGTWLGPPSGLSPACGADSCKLRVSPSIAQKRSVSPGKALTLAAGHPHPLPGQGRAARRSL